jgi:hypothetical protein
VPPDVREALREAAPEPQSPLDTHDIARRARRLKVRNRAFGLGALVVAVSLAVPLSGAITSYLGNRKSELPVRLGPADDNMSREGLPSPAERAATVAIAAFTKAGLHGLEGYDYGAVEELSAIGWTAYFCSPTNPPAGVCDPNTADTRVMVEQEGDLLRVVGVDSESDINLGAGVVGYSESAAAEAPQYIFDPVHIVKGSKGEGVEAYIYWTGAIRSHLETACRMEALDHGGSVIYQREIQAMQPPSVEGARDGIFLGEFPKDVRGAVEARFVCDPWHYKAPDRPPEPPEGPIHVVASGVFDETWGKDSGKRWFLVARADDEMYCWQHHVGELKQIEDSLQGASCIPRSTKGKAADENFLGWGFSESPESTNAFAYGQVSERVARIEFRLDDGGVVEADLRDAPPELDIPTRYFVAFLPHTSAEIVLLSASGDVLDKKSLTPRTEDSKPIIFPVQDPTNSVMQSLIEGTLTVRERCLYLSVDELPYDLVLPIWPEGFSYNHADGTLSVLDADGQTVAQTGSPVSMGGGMLGETAGAPLPPELKSRAGSCDGPYWIVGEIPESP